MARNIPEYTTKAERGSNNNSGERKATLLSSCSHFALRQAFTEPLRQFINYSKTFRKG